MNTLRGCAQVILDEIPFEEAAVYPETSVFYRYSTKIFPQYSGDEIKNIYEAHVKHKTVFDVIYNNAQQFLDEVDDGLQRGFVCKEGQGLRWRSLFLKLGQDVFTTALLAVKNESCSSFTWKPIIDICAKGVPTDKCPDNHFHLKGSSQVFLLNFIRVMNHIDGCHKVFNRLVQYYDGRFVLGADGGRHLSLYEKCRITAAIRLYLFSKISHGIENIFEGSIDCSILDVDATDEPALQHCIEAYRTMVSNSYEVPLMDYAQANLGEQTINDSNGLALLAGERQFLYLCFRNVFDDDVRTISHWTDNDSHYFYVYLILKNAFRRELVQTNGRLGFLNFSDYQDRKELFIESYPRYKKKAHQLAINYTLDNGFVSTLEARISPKPTAKKMREEILSIYNNAFPLNDENRTKLSLVLHFVKSKEKPNESDDIPRDFATRIKVQNKARAIAIMLANRNSLRHFVRGIDACSNEIGCRPEVFAPSFRYLMNMEINGNLSEGPPVPNLNATYHVGEDFLDITDGLRAIDEVMLYMGFGAGNRLGHALALGIDADEYYQIKEFQMVMSKQDLLDNIVWLIERSKECKIQINHELHKHLCKKAIEMSEYIYGFADVASFYRAWKLRGDDPRFYVNPNCFNMVNNTYDVLGFSECFLKNSLVRDDERSDASVYKWYHRYHFDGAAKKRGAEKTVFSLEGKQRQDYVRLVTDMQNQLLAEIKRKGIHIETNPSSNFLIGSFRRYENHPIFRFFCVGDLPENSTCVSINTDDLGVFDTSLQNEYALLATALRKRGHHSETEISNYLKSIQEFGKIQVFQ